MDIIQSFVKAGFKLKNNANFYQEAFEWIMAQETSWALIHYPRVRVNRDINPMKLYYLCVVNNEFDTKRIDEFKDAIKFVVELYRKEVVGKDGNSNEPDN